jgi:hypothetical protein
VEERRLIGRQPLRQLARISPKLIEVPSVKVTDILAGKSVCKSQWKSSEKSAKQRGDLSHRSGDSSFRHLCEAHFWISSWADNWGINAV